MAGLILDASALIAMLRSEPGGDMVAGALAGARMSVVNHAEVVAHYAKAGGDADMIAAMLRPLPIALIDADHILAMAAGLLQPATDAAGLSLGDRFCLALAKREALPAWTADRAWARIADAVGVEVKIIR